MQHDTWFGPEEEPLLGFLTVPENPDGTAGDVRGGVVLCPPLGHEQIVAYRTMRLAADALAARGIATLRFDYAGEGDSAGDTARADAPERWLASVEHAVAFLRASGIRSIALVGLTSGALIAARAAERIDGLDALVLWDPVLAGSRFLRRQRTLYEVTVGDTSSPVVDHVQLLSLALHPDAAAWLEGVSLDAATLRASAPDVFALVRASAAGTPAVARLRAGLGAGPGGDAVAEEDSAADASVLIDGMEDLLEVPSALSRMPVAAIAALVDHLDARLPTEAAPARPCIRPTAVVGAASDGTPIVESLHRIGPDRLFAIDSYRAGEAPGSERGALVLQPGAAEHRVGPSRFQVIAGRRMAARGFRVVRFDRRITGESTPVAADEANLIFAEAWVDDVDRVANALGAERLGHIGLCAGGWAAARVAERRPAQLTVLLSPNYFKTRALAPGEYAALQRMEQEGVPRLGGLKARVRDAIPGWVWRLAARTQLFHDPAQLFAAPLAHRDGSVAIMLTPDDAEHFAAHRGFEAVGRLRRRGADLQLTSYPFGDHSLFGPDVRSAMLEDLTELVERRFPVRAVLPAEARVATGPVEVLAGSAGSVRAGASASASASASRSGGRR